MKKVSASFSVFESKHLPSLDGMRFFAACLVVLNHSGVHLPIMDRVTFFLILSGFLFTWIYSRAWDRSQSFAFKDFYLKRAIRILPAFYFSILLTIVGKTLLHRPVDPWAVAASVLNFSNYYNAFNGHWSTGFEHYWTLSLEEQFYLVWPLLFVFFMKRGRKALSAFLVAALAASFAWRYLLATGAWIKVTPSYIYNALDTRLDSLTIGCLLGLWVTHPSVGAGVARIARRGYEPILTFASICTLNLLDETFRNTYGFTLQAILVAIFMLQVMHLHQHPLWSWLNHRWLVFLGTLSFSMYLLHGWGIAFGRKMTFLPGWGQTLACIAFTLVFAALSYFFIEKPALAFRSRLFKKPAPHVPARSGGTRPAPAVAAGSPASA